METKEQLLKSFLYFKISESIGMKQLKEVLESNDSISYKEDNLDQFKRLLIYKNNKEIGIASVLGVTPTLYFYKRNKTIATQISNHNLIKEITRESGRILDWHKFENNKLHILSDGSIKLYLNDNKPTQEEINDVYIKLIENGFNPEIKEYGNE